jgi:hypothetical protein
MFKPMWFVTFLVELFIWQMISSGGPKVPVARAAARACWTKTTLIPLVDYDDLTILITCMCAMPRLEKLPGSATDDKGSYFCWLIMTDIISAIPS